MIKSRAVFAASAVFLSAALAASFVLTDDLSRMTIKLHKIEPSQVLTWDCEYPQYKPEIIMIYCGDGGAYINKITWISWSKDGASGNGEYYENLCNPNCADGKFLHAPVDVRLSELTRRKGKYFLRKLDINTITRKDFPWAETGHFEWNVMEFSDNFK
ncbi:hypothetical protein MCEMRE217_00473 [Candidatus Nanopelagicaceae bacterium]